jgi:hypothetical protein
MKNIVWASLMCLLLLAAGSVVADDRQDCLNGCSDQFDQCSAGCYVYACIQECQYYQSQCEQGCPQCYPDWQEVSRVVQGTYGTSGGGWPVYCEHHRVEWVTQQDMNHCGYPYGEYQSYCHDEQDGAKIATHSVDCCDGEDINGNPDSTFDCNHYHQCTG